MALYTDDWFLPASQGRLSVEASLDAVLQREEARLYFVTALKNALVSPDHHLSDSISAIRWKLSDLNKTLDFRLGMLQKDRPQAWFRPCSAAELGPFPAKINFSSLLPQFGPQKARRLRNELIQLWSHKQSSGPLLPQGDYLWSYLLGLNQALNDVCQMGEPYQDLRLDELPEGLPDELISPSLCRYLEKVKNLVNLTSSELNDCFQKFFQVTESFLLSYYQKPAQEEFRRQSYGRTQTLCHNLRASLTFMNFTTPPSLSELKKRYFQLAKLYHPDSSHGDAEKFHKLRKHYQKILEELRSSR